MQNAFTHSNFIERLFKYLNQFVKDKRFPRGRLYIKKVSQKILYLIKKWGMRFESQKDIIPNFYETYNALKNSGVVFPNNME